MPTRWSTLVALVLILAPGAALALNRCTLTATGTCASYHATIQAAADAASPATLDRVMVGPGVYDEIVVLPVRVNATFQPGAVLNGEWHDSHFGVHELRAPVINGRVYLHPGSGRLKIIGGVVTCALTSDAGIILEGVDNVDLGNVEVTGCPVGIDNVGSFGTYAHGVKVHDNIIGFRLDRTRSGEQYFRNFIDRNQIGIQITVADGDGAASHTDVNSNTLTCAPGGIGFQMNVDGPDVNENMEYNFNALDGCAGLHWQIQTCAGPYVIDPTLSPGSSEQYGSGNKADGAALPVYTTPPSPGC